MAKAHFCAKCGSDVDLVLGGSGSYICAYCRGVKNSDSMHRYYINAWRKQVQRDEAQLNRDIAEANRLGMSYGQYMVYRHQPDKNRGADEVQTHDDRKGN